MGDLRGALWGRQGHAALDPHPLSTVEQQLLEGTALTDVALDSGGSSWALGQADGWQWVSGDTRVHGHVRGHGVAAWPGTNVHVCATSNDVCVPVCLMWCARKARRSRCVRGSYGNEAGEHKNQPAVLATRSPVACGELGGDWNRTAAFWGADDTPLPATTTVLPGSQQRLHTTAVLCVNVCVTRGPRAPRSVTRNIHGS